MKITINQQVFEVSERSSLQSIISEKLGGNTKGMAIAVNDNVIAKEAHPSYLLQPNDSIIIIQATQGG
ncbi:sulfur carrier protein ThiS [Arcticibacter sp.]|jgi:sulfur carrier protein|uniref:sulfur carrier protein ThiS n=1 Tax=Arcticibacter sp. TaxID=1872630 RepID=UPI00388FAE83